MMIRRRKGTQRRGADECVDDYEKMGGVSNMSTPASTGFESPGVPRIWWMEGCIRVSTKGEVGRLSAVANGTEVEALSDFNA